MNTCLPCPPTPVPHHAWHHVRRAIGHMRHAHHWHHVAGLAACCGGSAWLATALPVAPLAPLVSALPPGYAEAVPGGSLAMPWELRAGANSDQTPALDETPLPAAPLSFAPNYLGPSVAPTPIYPGLETPPVAFAPGEQPTPVPEPASALVLAAGLAAVLVFNRRKS